jgi:hypothetical protein
MRGSPIVVWLATSANQNHPHRVQKVIDASTNKPLNATEIQKQAQDATGSETAGSDEVANQLKLQQDMEKQAEQERQKIMEPQMQELHQAMQKLNTGVLQGKQQAMGGNEAFGGLEKEMTNINTLLGTMQKQIL